MDIQLVHINKKFQDTWVLQDLNITIIEGKTNCIMGPSGIGKTTLFHILMGLIKQDSGNIHGVQGKRIAAVFQEDRLIDHWDAVKNVQLVCGKSVSAQLVKMHFTEVGLTEYENKPVSQLSGGMRRRVAIVRAILAESELVLMDEPFKGLDHKLKHQVICYVKDKTQGKTVVIITHEQEEVQLLEAIPISLH